MKIINRFKEIRKERDLTQEQMAKLLDIPIFTYMKWDYNSNQPKKSIHKNLSKRLKMPEEEIFIIVKE